MRDTNKKIQPFGTVLGHAPGDVAAYSSDYATASESEYPRRSSYRSYLDNIFMGYKWQCVEFARRWLYLNKGYIFDDVAMAYDIFGLRSVRDIKTNSRLPLNAFANGNKKHPEPGCLLIWNKGGEFEGTGHVAVVTEVTDQYLRIAEQNVGQKIWPENGYYARELHAKVTSEGEYWVTCSFGDAEILGWMIQTDQDTYAEPTEEKDPQLFTIKSAHAHLARSTKQTWLNVANDDEAAFVDAMGGHFLTAVVSEQTRYFILSKSAEDKLEHATNELHGLFMHATEYVLNHPELLRKFNLPAAVLPKIQHSWNNRLNHLITSRFDFALTEQGIKVYEYNCDSASCYMEAGKVQGKWAQHYRVTESEDAGKDLFAELVQTWQKNKATGLIHILCDKDPEELYHALFMQDVMRAADIPSKLLIGLSGLTWNTEGDVIDAEGERIEWVWKTWAWETALDQIRDEYQTSTPPTDNSAAQAHTSSWVAGQAVKLSEVLLHDNIMVFEPLWSLIPSNKAILPVLWMLFPNHPLLLNASYELTEELKVSGYVAKPIVGRCGANIALVDHDDNLLEATKGKFAEQDKIYQQLFPLPLIDGYYIQICTFSAAGIYAGSGVRADTSMVINQASDCLPLRFVSDKQFLSEPVLI